LAAANEQSLRNDERQWNLESESGSYAEGRFDLNFAVQLVQVRSYHVEPDSASGKFRLARSGREARMEEEFQHVAIFHLLRLLRSQETGFDGSLTDLAVIDAAAVVFDLDVDMVAAMVSANSDTSLVGLPGVISLFVALDAVGDGVTYKMQQRIGDLLDDVVIELGFRTGQRYFDLLVGCLGGIANSARDTRIKIADRHHAGLRDFILQAMRKLGELIDVGVNAPDEAIELRENL